MEGIPRMATIHRNIRPLHQAITPSQQVRVLMHINQLVPVVMDTQHSTCPHNHTLMQPPPLLRQEDHNHLPPTHLRHPRKIKTQIQMTKESVILPLQLDSAPRKSREKLVWREEAERREMCWEDWRGGYRNWRLRIGS